MAFSEAGAQHAAPHSRYEIDNNVVFGVGVGLVVRIIVTGCHLGFGGDVLPQEFVRGASAWEFGCELCNVCLLC